MKEIGDGLKAIWKGDRGLMVMMMAMIVMGVVLFIFAVATLNPTSSVTKVGYGDIGGYRDGAWQGMLNWVLLAPTLSILNNLVVVKVYQKNGGGMARLLAGMSMLLMVMGFIVLVRLLGES